MSGRFKDALRCLRSAQGGNATLMVALGVPALVGGAGLAVDTAQWYLWKSELQFALDQSALAAGYALSNEDTADIWESRAQREFDANISTIGNIVSDPTFERADWDDGDDNSVVVSATVSARLPFTSFLTNQAADIPARAQATFSEGDGGFTSCIIALSPHDSKAIWFNGGPDVTAGCGVAALSDSSKAIEVSGGSGTLDLGWLVSAGGVDSYFDGMDGVQVHENQDDMFDPFASLTPPDNPTPRELSCGSPVTYTATYDVEISVANLRYQGAAKNSLTLFSTTPVSSGTTTETGAATAATRVGDVIGPSSATVELNSGSTGSGKSKTYYRTDQVTTTTRTVIAVETDGGGGGMMQPGTYSDFDLACDTVLAPGIYVIDGCTLDTQTHSLTGNGVMFVLRNGAGIKINGNASVNLTAMNAEELIGQGLSAEDADKLAGMLIFEDPESDGNGNNKLNGNADTFLNGTIYLPVSALEILGTASVSSRCLTIAANTVKIGGTADLSTFCPPGMTNETRVSGGEASVRLVG